MAPVNMKICDRHNVMKHREIKESDEYITLEILLNFGILDNMRITSSEPKDYLGRPGKVLITSLGLETNVKSNRDKKTVNAITNVIMKEFSKIIKEFEKLT